MCGGGVRSILLLPLVARCIETIDFCLFLVFYKEKDLFKKSTKLFAHKHEI